MITNEAIEELISTAHSRSAAKHNLKRYIQENQWQVGPDRSETLGIFNRMRDTLADAYVVLDNLKRLHKTKTILRTAMGMFNHVTSLRPQADEDQASLLMKSMAGSFDEYARYYQTYINEES